MSRDLRADAGKEGEGAEVACTATNGYCTACGNPYVKYGCTFGYGCQCPDERVQRFQAAMASYMSAFLAGTLPEDARMPRREDFGLSEGEPY